jgi:hypothetical protein
MRAATNSVNAEKGIDSQPRVLPALDLQRPIRAAVLTNPIGGFNRRRDHLAQVRRAAAAYDANHVEAEMPEDIYRAACELDADGTELLIVNGGDGTLQMILTALFAHARQTPPPLIALVPGGTSNTIHGDAGWAGRPPDGIRAALESARRGRLDGHVVQRAVLLVQSPLWERPMCAMQFSAGAIYNAIKFAKRKVEGRGAHGQTGPAVTLAWFIGSVLLGRSGEIFPPLRVKGSIDGHPLPDGDLLGILVSTLDHLFLGIRPYWGTGPGRLRYGALAYRPRHFLRAVPAVLRGQPNRFLTPENGYNSVNAEVLDLELDVGFMLDGELFDTAPGTKLRITAPTSVTFLRSGAG